MAYDDLDRLIQDARGAEAPRELDRVHTREALSQRIASGAAVPDIGVLSRAPRPPRAGLGTAVAVPAGLGLLAIGVVFALGRGDVRNAPPISEGAIAEGRAQAPGLSAAPSEPAEGSNAPVPLDRAPATSAPAPSEPLRHGPTSPPRVLPEPMMTPPSTHGPDATYDAPPAPNQPPQGRASNGNRGGRLGLDHPPAKERAQQWLRDAERMALARVQAALRQGAYAEARDRLDTDDRRFADGALSAERAAARVFAVCGGGDADQARVLAKAFVARYPSSPLRTRVLASCAASKPGRSP
ncbi:MAG TPA: hypothetical protein VMG12_17130 [Polyangiaceae bacterium]|nr:hypothetical protein [Polyangiaceae bacterium]